MKEKIINTADPSNYKERDVMPLWILKAMCTHFWSDMKEWQFWMWLKAREGFP